MIALCQQMKNISSRIWLSSWSCRWWDHVGARRALSPGLGVFNTRWRDSCGCPLVGLGADVGDIMSNSSTTENSILELKKKKKRPLWGTFEAFHLVTLTTWSRSFSDVLSKSFFSECQLNSNPRGRPGRKTKFLAGARNPRKWEAPALWNRNEGMCGGINKAKTGQIKLIEIQSLSLAGLINYSAYTRVEDGHSTYKTWIL